MLPPLEIVINGTTAGLDRALSRVDGLMGDLNRGTDRVAAGFVSFGGAADRLGRRMLPVSGGIAAMAGAMGLLVNSTVQAAQEVRLLAQLSNSSTDEFQRMAAAASSVGIEQDQLGDILKDVNDRVGDFLTTGGGPMADFFERIAPQVGVTADMFRDLSGPDALQLYVDSLQAAGVSQSEMTFFLEAMASDLTRLAPLLANGGIEMARLGDEAAAAGAIMDGSTIDAAAALAANVRTLQQNVTGAGRELSAAMIPVLNELVTAINTHVVPAMQNIVGGIGNAIEWFGQLPGPVQEAAGVIALALGTGGPILLAVGALATAIGGLIAATGPIGLMIAIAATLGAAWAVWGDDIIAIVGRVRDFFGEAFTTAREAVTGFATAAQEGVANAMQAIQERIEALMEWFAELPARFAEFGRNIIQGLLNGINEVWESLQARIVELGEMLPQWLRDMMGIASPSRVMHVIGSQIGEGLANGIAQTAALSQRAMAATSENIQMTAGQAAQSVLGSMAQMFQGSKPIAMAQALINTWQGITEALKLPFPANLAAAAQVAAQGFAAVRGIQSANIGGGSAGAASAAQAAPAARPTQNVVIDLAGASAAQVDQFQSFADTFNEAARQGLMNNVLVRGA